MPVTPKAAAETVNVPDFFPRAIPFDLTLATCGFEDFHVTLVSTAVLPSLYVPVAVNFTKVPLAIVGLAGVIAIDCNATLETVRVVDWVTEPNDAPIVVFPVAKLFTKPLALMDATDRLDELQSTNVVMSSELLSLKVPIAVNCFVAPAGMDEFSGAIARETKVALVTVTDAVPVIDPDVAVTVAVPAATPVPNPEESIVRMPDAPEDH